MVVSTRPATWAWSPWLGCINGSSKGTGGRPSVARTNSRGGRWRARRRVVATRWRPRRISKCRT